MNHLDAYGWNAHFASFVKAEGEEDWAQEIGRVVQEHKEAYLVRSAAGNVWAEISGKMRHEGAVRSDFPAVGDWVVLRGLEHVQAAEGEEDGEGEGDSEPGNSQTGESGPVQITRILPRKTVLARTVEGGHEQVLAVNVDVAFLAASLNENFNVRRLERYLMMVRGAGAVPVVLLTKADLCADVGPFVEEVRGLAGIGGAGARGMLDELAIHPISVVTGQGIDEVRKHLTRGVTAVVLGSSGIGKSTLVNYLAEADIQDMMETRDFDDKGRHCTTFRHLVRTRAGGLIIDTPGLRGLMLGEAADALATFGDIEALAAGCKFSNCGHETEPGCAIKGALEAGTLEAGRYESFVKLQREVAALGRRGNRVAERKQKKLVKKANAEMDEKAERKWGRGRTRGVERVKRVKRVERVN